MLPINVSAAAMTAALVALETVGEAEVFKSESPTSVEWLIRFYADGDPAHVGPQSQVTINASTVTSARRRRLLPGGGAARSRSRRLGGISMNVVSVNDGSSPLEVGNLTVVDDVGVNATDSQSVTVTPVVHVCGNGIRSTAEQCDDNNTIGADGCDSLCVVETGFTCTSSTEQDGGSGVGGLDTCAAVCGDGRRISWGGENCDDNNTAGGDGCSAACAIEAGFICTGGSFSSPDTCSSPCGDGLRVGTEGCDDGGLVAGDGCGATCEIETGYTCSGGSSSSADTCVPCHETCAACSGTASTDCTVCASAYPFTNFQGGGLTSCVADCTPLAKYANGSGICVPCDDTCAICSPPHLPRISP